MHLLIDEIIPIFLVPFRERMCQSITGIVIHNSRKAFNSKAFNYFHESWIVNNYGILIFIEFSVQHYALMNPEIEDLALKMANYTKQKRGKNYTYLMYKLLNYI
jgi:hypothetical protein